MEDVKSPPASFLAQLQQHGPARTGSAIVRSRQDWALYLATGAFLVVVLVMPFITYNDLPLTGEGSSERQISYLLILGLAIYGARTTNARWKLMAMPVPILLALGWCWLSLTWAIAPEIGARRLLLTTVICWTTFLVVQQAGYRSTLDIVRSILVVALFANYAVVFLDPSMGIHMMKDSEMATVNGGAKVGHSAA